MGSPTQVLEGLQSPGQSLGSPSPTQYPPSPVFFSPGPVVRNEPPGIVRPPNDSPIQPSRELFRLVEEQIKPKFNDVYKLIAYANTIAKTKTDTEFWSPVLRDIQRSVAMFVPLMGARRKSRRRRSRR